MSDRFGATPEKWHHYSSVLGLTAHLLPVVSNPHAKISSLSNMKGLGKTPSVYNAQGLVAGLPKWTDMQVVERQIERWAEQPDYGICIQTRAIRAIDIDVPDEAKAKAIVDAITLLSGLDFPMRFRPHSGKCLLAFKYDGLWPKRVIPVDGGVIEWLGDGQQFIAEGFHESGDFYQWEGDLADAPTLDETQLEALWSEMVARFAIGEPRIARAKREGKGTLDLQVHDPVADWLNDNWETYDVGNDGQLFIACPFEREHTSDSGPSATAYFPAGTGGYQQGHFVCLHAHCAGRPDSDYLDETGYNVAQFEDISALYGDVLEGHTDDAQQLPPPPSVDRSGLGQPSAHPSASVAQKAGLKDLPTRLVRDKSGRLEATADNLRKMIARPDLIFMHIAHDSFKDEMVWAPGDQPLEEAQWRTFGDADYIEVQVQLERRGFKAIGKQLLRDATHAVAQLHKLDTAQTWLDRLEWDGVPRVETFARDVWGWADTEYSRAVSRYVWSALAGRVIEPGVRADMAPILVGAQGIRKSSALQLMAPDEEFYVEIKLDERDADMSRRLRGKLVGELEELRGLNSRAVEEIKAFITRRHESWVPKFKEFEARYWRRTVLIGTTNEDEFLADPTGERRWLPGKCERRIDLDLLAATRDQLWAEGAMRFACFGVEWQDAELLAPAEHGNFKVNDVWAPRVIRWLGEEGINGVAPKDQPWVRLDEALAGAVGLPSHAHDRGKEIRMGKVLKGLGFTRARRTIDGEQQPVYIR